MPRKPRPPDQHHEAHIRICARLGTPGGPRQVVMAFEEEREAVQFRFRFYDFRNALRHWEYGSTRHKVAEGIEVRVEGFKTIFENKNLKYFEAMDRGEGLEASVTDDNSEAASQQRLIQKQIERDRLAATTAPPTVDDGTLTDAQLMALQYGATPASKPPAPAGVPAPAVPAPTTQPPARVQSLDDEDPMAEHEAEILKFLTKED